MLKRLMAWWRTNVAVDCPAACPECAGQPDPDWEPIDSFDVPLVRCRKCGDLIRAAARKAHLEEAHGRKMIAIIRLYENGDGEADVQKQMTLMPTHVRLIGDFLKQQTDALLADAVAEIRQTDARGRAQLLRLIGTEGPVQ